MKIGDRDTPGTRINAEREFRESCQVLVATEASGEGINLQFCWFMINHDIPWNPMRLEQRMGRIHRYGQEKDCLILNFVPTNTREGRHCFGDGTWVGEKCGMRTSVGDLLLLAQATARSVFRPMSFRQRVIAAAYTATVSVRSSDGPGRELGDAITNRCLC
jgi:helicase-like protein